MVEEVLQEVCLVEFTSSVCTICLLEYYCIVVRSNMYIIYLKITKKIKENRVKNLKIIFTTYNLIGLAREQ